VLVKSPQISTSEMWAIVFHDRGGENWWRRGPKRSNCAWNAELGSEELCKKKG